MSRKNRQKKRLAERKAQRKEATKVHLEQAPPPYRGHVPLEKVDEVRFRVPQRGLMRTHGMVYSDEALLPDLQSDRCLEQVANVATLPGIVGASMAMPDIHMGYGFPIGGVAAFAGLTPLTGVLPATAAAVFVVGSAIPGFRWHHRLVLALAIAAGIWLIFVRGLGMPFVPIRWP